MGSTTKAQVQRSTVPAPRTDAFFPARGVQVLLQAMAFEQSAPLSVMAVELLPRDIEPLDPLGADLARGPAHSSNLVAYCGAGNLLRRCRVTIGSSERRANASSLEHPTDWAYLP